jgi:bis(5'-nucleosidyl)-tetraphosphatase
MVARRAAGLVIYRQVGGLVQWLLLQTSYGQNHWTPPKGHLDPGEDDMMAAMRETKEEAGLGSEQLEVFENEKVELQYEAFGNPKIVTYWMARYASVVRISPGWF